MITNTCGGFQPSDRGRPLTSSVVEVILWLYPLCFVFWNVSEVYTKSSAHTDTSLFGSLERETLWGRGMLTHPSSEFLNSAGRRTEHKLVGSWMCWCLKGSAFNVVTVIAGEILMCWQRTVRICVVTVWRQDSPHVQTQPILLPRHLDGCSSPVGVLV